MSGMRITLFVTMDDDSLVCELAASGTGIIAVKLISSYSEAQDLFFLSCQTLVLTLPSLECSLCLETGLESQLRLEMQVSKVPGSLPPLQTEIEAHSGNVV